MDIRAFSKRLRRDRKGNVMILTAAAMPLLVGSAGLAVDTIQLSLLKRQLQRAADSAALAGAFARVQQKSVTGAVNKALNYDDSLTMTAPVIENAPTVGPYAKNDRAVRVILSGTGSAPFMAFFIGGRPKLRAEATAALVYTGKYCMVALDDSVGTGITFAGNSTVKLGCGVVSNNSGPAAVSASGSAAVIASPIAAVGGVPPNGAYKGDTLLLPYSLKQPDPFANLPSVNAPSPCSGGTVIVASQKDVKNIGPGCYTGMQVQGTLNLAPGTYYITGDFVVNSQARVYGHGVTMIFTSQTPSTQSSYPNIQINGSAQLDMSAPTSGAYEGVLMQYDSRKQGGDYFINGNSYSKLEGAFYFPNQNLTFNGNSEMETNCIQLVARHLTFTGNTEITNTCPTGGGAKAFDASWVRLVA